MEIRSRPYQSSDDLYAIGKLIRRAYHGMPCLNAWSFCRFDIWAQRRIADAEAFLDRNWQQQFRLWIDDSGIPIGTAFAIDNHHWRKNSNAHAIILDPEHMQLAEAMLDWVEMRVLPEVEVFESNPLLNRLLQLRGYTRSKDAMIVREKSLANKSFEVVNLPHGYRIKVLRRKDWISYFVAVNAVFNMMDTVDAFRSIQQAPSNVPELHLQVINDSGEIAAFCSVWWDRENNLAEFEPVGTVPRFQRLGLASALLTHASNRMRDMGIRNVRVESWSESPAANRLYECCGLQEKDRIYRWEKGTG
jgi:mycothiol synthase